MSPLVERLLVDFYVSDSYDPKAARPADTVKAAIAFTITQLEARQGELVEESEDNIDRVAQAIANVDSKDVNPNWRLWRDHARAAIRALAQTGDQP